MIRELRAGRGGRRRAARSAARRRALHRARDRPRHTTPSRSGPRQGAGWSTRVGSPGGRGIRPCPRLRAAAGLPRLRPRPAIRRPDGPRRAAAPRCRCRVRRRLTRRRRRPAGALRRVHADLGRHPGRDALTHVLVRGVERHGARLPGPRSRRELGRAARRAARGLRAARCRPGLAPREERGDRHGTRSPASGPRATGEADDDPVGGRARHRVDRHRQHQNAGMLAINERLGYRPLLVRTRWVKRLA